MLKKNNQCKRNYLLTSKQQNTVSKVVPTLYGEQPKKMAKKNLKLVFHLSVSLTTIHVVKLIPSRASKTTMMTKKRKMATLMPFDDRHSGYGETHIISFVLTRQRPKVSK